MYQRFFIIAVLLTFHKALTKSLIKIDEGGDVTREKCKRSGGWRDGGID